MGGIDMKHLILAGLLLAGTASAQQQTAQNIARGLFGLQLLNHNQPEPFDQEPLSARSLHGKLMSCSSVRYLDEALATNNQQFFDGWSEQDYAVAIRLASCRPNDPNRLDLLRWRTDNFHDAQALQNRQQAAAQQAAYNLANCRRTREGELFGIQQQIKAYDPQYEFATNQLEHQKRVGEVSGVVDMRAIQSAGEMIVHIQDQRAILMRRFKDLGGPIDNATGGPIFNLIDPCGNQQQVARQ